MALTVSKIDRLAWNSIVSAGSSSTLNTPNNAVGGSRTNMITSYWDSLLAELKCSDYAFKAPVSPSGIDANQFISFAMPSNAMTKTRVFTMSSYNIYDINQAAADSTSSNNNAATSNIFAGEVSTTCVTSGYRSYLPIQFTQQVVKINLN